MRLSEINSPGELSVDPDLIDRFTSKGWQIDGEGQDQLVMSKPGSNTVLKVVGSGSLPRQAQIRRYVEFFRANQRDPHFPRVGADRELVWKGRKYYAYTQERLRPLGGDERVMDYLQYAMGELGHDQEPDFERIPPGLSVEQIEGLIGSVDHMFQAGLGGQYGFDLANMANIMQRADGQLVIVDPFSGFDDELDEALVHRGQIRSQDPNDMWHVRDDATRKLRHHRGGVVLAQARPQIYQDDAKASYTYTTDARGRRRRSLPSFHWAYIQGRMVKGLPQDISQGRKLWFKRGQGFVYADSQEPFASADYVAFNPDGSVVAYDSGRPAAAAGPVVSVEPAQQAVAEQRARSNKYQKGHHTMKTMREYIDLVGEAQPLTEARAQAPLPGSDAVYTVVFYNAGDETYKTIAKVRSPEKALQIIKSKFNEMYDTGDRLRKVAPNIYVLEPDYENTGERATADNYDHMYHWVIKAAAA